MKLVIFGLAVSSSWGNGHATLWRGLIGALVSRGHRVVFFERDEPFYAAHRDFQSSLGFEIVIYSQWEDVGEVVHRHVREADAVIVTSYCRDAVMALEHLVTADYHPRIFYDLDSPVTLENIQNSSRPFYIGEGGLGDYDLVLSYTGGSSLEGLKTVLGAKKTVALYGCVDPQVHRPVCSVSHPALLSYLGTYAPDRQRRLKAFMLDVADKLREQRFVIGGALYPESFPWLENIAFIRHVAPSQHPSFYCSSRFTLNITRLEMARCGYCPSARLFEAAACGVPVISDRWEGMEQFFRPGEEIVTVDQTIDVVNALGISDSERMRISRHARERVLAEHTASQRAKELEQIIMNHLS